MIDECKVCIVWAFLKKEDSEKLLRELIGIYLELETVKYGCQALN